MAALFRHWAVACGLFVVAQGQAQTRPDPLADLKTLEVADGFEVSLFSADPSVAKPIQMSFDARGRLWVVTSQSYPQLEPGADPQDRVYVLEDSNGDGVADKSTVFAEGLTIPTGIEVARNGAYVGHSTEVLFLEDADGDGKADRTHVALAGFGTEDTHHLVHSFRWGPGGDLYFAQSVYIHSHVETPRGVRRLNGGGFWRFRPDSQRLEVFVHGMVNSWGIAFDDFGQAFGVDNDHVESALKYFLPGARLKHTPGETHLLTGIVQGKPKYCGAEFIASPHFPDDWQGNLIVCDFRAHRVCRYRLRDAGAGFAADELAPLITSSNQAFRPVDVKMGPDGALYVCDWYNPIINHGEVDFRDPRRDKTHGRIWRVTAKGRPRSPRPNLVSASIDALIDLQKSPDGLTRHFARRVLAERPKADVAMRLGNWIEAQSEDRTRLHGLWVYETIDEPNAALLNTLLSSSDFRIRAAAVRTLAHWHDRIADPVGLLAKRVQDEHPRVRMEAVRALAELSDPRAAETALGAVDRPMDYFLDYAVKLTAREAAPRWLPLLASKLKQPMSATEANRWAYALIALDSAASAGPLLEIWQLGLVPAERQTAAFETIARHGSPPELRRMLDIVANGSADKHRPESATLAILGALGEAQRLRGAAPQGDLAGPVRRLLQDPAPAVRLEAVRLAGKWRVAGVWDQVAGVAAGAEVAPASQTAAIAALGDYGTSSIPTLVKIAQSATDRQMRFEAIGTLVPLAPNQAAQLARPLVVQATDPGTAAELVRRFVRHRSGPPALAEALAGATLAEPVAREAVRAVNASGQAAPDLVGVLSKAGGLPDTAREPTLEQLASLAADVQRLGNAQRGEAVYRREKLQCVKCHAIGGAGGKVGPDLTTIGTSAPVDYLVESLLAPNKKVKENFHSLVVATGTGEIFTGIPVQQADDQWILRTAEDRTVSIPKNQIETSRMAGSLMPTDVMDSVSTPELLDLVRFLSELGKPGPYGPTKELVARQWRLLGPLDGATADAVAARLAAAGGRTLNASESWQTSLTTFAGWVYLREYALNAEKKHLFAACTVRVERPGKLRLVLEPGPAARCRIAGKPLTPVQTAGTQSHYDVELSAGVHELLVRIDLTTLPTVLRLTGFPLAPGAGFDFLVQ